MAGQIRLFEKTDTGLLIQVYPSEADEKRSGRKVSFVHLPIEVLWTAEEEAQSAMEEVQLRAESQEDIKSKQKMDNDIQSAREKLSAMGFIEDEIKILLH